MTFSFPRIYTLCVVRSFDAAPSTVAELTQSYQSTADIWLVTMASTVPSGATGGHSMYL